MPQGATANNKLLLHIAEELAYTCYLTHARQPTFLSPQITYFNEAGKDPSGGSAGKAASDFYHIQDDYSSHYDLRPETVESLWYLYYLTGNKTYQDWGWNIFQVKINKPKCPKCHAVI